MRIAALYDVHGNVRALEAVLADAGDVDAYVFGADIRANWERYLLEGKDEWAVQHVSQDNVREWPAALTLDGALSCHAAPRSDEELVLQHGTRIVNPGSVGNPNLRTTDYDTVAASEEMRTSAFPRPDLADELLEPYTVERILELFPA